MAKRKNNSSKKLTGGAILTVVVALIATTINTFIPFSDEIPTWSTLLDSLSDVSNQGSGNKTPSENVDGVKQEIHVIDVEQGSCTLVISGDEAVLIDAGERDKGDVILDYMEEVGVDKLDYVIATHPHSDHIGGMADVINNIEVENIIMPVLSKKLTPTTRVYENMLTAIYENDVNVISADVYAKYALGNSEMEVFSPKGEWENLNDTSVATRITVGDVSLMVTGDMEKPPEKELIKLGYDYSADIFVLGHHGSTTSNTNALLDEIGAKYYVAQVGMDNSYGHPHEEIVEEVDNRQGKLYRSDMDGTIIFLTDGEGIEVKTTK